MTYIVGGHGQKVASSVTNKLIYFGYYKNSTFIFEKISQWKTRKMSV